MATLTNTKIKDTYDGLLKTTDNEALDISGVTLIEDGLGNASALSVGRSGNGVTITGSLNATLVTMGQNLIDGSSDNFKISADSGNVSGSSTIEFLVDGSERMRIDSSGNVGIGVTPTSVTHGPHLEVGNLRGTVSAGTGYFEDNGGTNFLNGARPLAFGVAGSERMRIDSSGNVGIGTSSEPYGGNKLNIRGANKSLSSSAGGNLAVYTSDSQAANIGGSIALGGVYTSTTAYQFAGIAGLKENSTAGQAGGYLALYTTNSSNATIERMRITSGGAVAINSDGSVGGKMSSKSDAAGTECYNAWNAATSGTRYLHYFGTGSTFSAVGSITTDGSATSYNTTSDYRLKENVVEMTGALDRVDALKPSRFNFIADPEKTIDGFLAHEVQAIVPEAVTGEKDAVDEEGNPIYQGIDQSKIVPLLVGAIKELRAEIELLKSQLQ